MDTDLESEVGEDRSELLTGAGGEGRVQHLALTFVVFACGATRVNINCM